MTELDSTATARQRSEWAMWLIWVAATCAGVVALTLLLTAARSLPESLDFLRVILVMLQLPGILALSGAAQQLALRFCLPREKGWFRRTLLGALSGIPAGLLLAFLVGYLLALADRLRYARVYGRLPANQGAPFGEMSIALLAGIILLTVVAQGRLLRRHSRRAVWWPVPGLLGWATGFLAAGNLMFPKAGFLSALPYYIFEQGSFRAEGPGPAVSIAAGVVLGLLAGAITGAGLICILRARPPGVAREKLPQPQQEAP
jgi:hypothetical protein